MAQRGSTAQHAPDLLVAALHRGLAHTLRKGTTDEVGLARLQVAQFLTRAPVDAGAALRALNSMLPPDIVVSAVQRVPIDFNVRPARGPFLRASTCAVS